MPLQLTLHKYLLQDMDDAEEAKQAATATWAALKRSTKCGPRRTVRAGLVSRAVAVARPVTHSHVPPRNALNRSRSLSFVDKSDPASVVWLAVQLPSVEEIVAHLQGVRLTTIVFFLDETFEEVAYDITTSVAEAVEQLAGLIRLQNYQTFTLYEAVRPVNPKLNPEPLPDEHLLLDEHR